MHAVPTSVGAFVPVPQLLRPKARLDRTSWGFSRSSGHDGQKAQLGLGDPRRRDFLGAPGPSWAFLLPWPDENERPLLAQRAAVRAYQTVAGSDERRIVTESPVPSD